MGTHVSPCVNLILQCEASERGDLALRVQWKLSTTAVIQHKVLCLALDVPLEQVVCSVDGKHVGLQRSPDNSQRVIVDIPAAVSEPEDHPSEGQHLRVSVSYTLSSSRMKALGIVARASAVDGTLAVHSAAVSQQCAWIPWLLDGEGLEVPVLAKVNFGSSLCRATESGTPCEDLLEPRATSEVLTPHGDEENACWWWSETQSAPRRLSAFVLVFGPSSTTGIPLQVCSEDGSMAASWTLQHRRLLMSNNRSGEEAEEPAGSGAVHDMQLEQLDFDLTTIIKVWQFLCQELGPRFMAHVLPAGSTWTLSAVDHAGPFAAQTLPPLAPSCHLSSSGLLPGTRPTWNGSIVCGTTQPIADQQKQLHLVFERTNQLASAFIWQLLAHFVSDPIQDAWLVLGLTQQLTGMFEARDSVFGNNHVQLRYHQWTTTLDRVLAAPPGSDCNPKGCDRSDRIFQLWRIRLMQTCDPTWVLSNSSPLQSSPLFVGAHLASLHGRMSRRAGNSAEGLEESTNELERPQLLRWDTAKSASTAQLWKLKAAVTWRLLEQLLLPDTFVAVLQRWLTHATTARLPAQRTQASFLELLKEAHVPSSSVWSVSEFVRIWLRHTVWPSMAIHYDHDQRSHETIVRLFHMDPQDREGLHRCLIKQVRETSENHDAESSDSDDADDATVKRKATQARRAKPGKRKSTDADASTGSSAAAPAASTSSHNTAAAGASPFIDGSFPLRLRVHELAQTTDQVLPLRAFPRDPSAAASMVAVELRFPLRGMVRRNKTRKQLSENQKARVPVDELLKRFMDSTVRWLRPDRLGNWPMVPMICGSRVMFLHQLVGEEDVIGQLQALLGLTRLHAGLVPTSIDLHTIGMSVDPDVVVRAITETIRNDAVYYPVRAEALRTLVHRWRGFDVSESNTVKNCLPDLLNWFDDQVAELLLSPSATTTSCPAAAEATESALPATTTPGTEATAAQAPSTPRPSMSAQPRTEQEALADPVAVGLDAEAIETSKMRHRIMKSLLLRSMLVVWSEMRQVNQQPPILAASSFERSSSYDYNAANSFTDDRVCTSLSSVFAQFFESQVLRVEHPELFLQFIIATGNLVMQAEAQAAYIWSMLVTLTRASVAELRAANECTNPESLWLSQATAGAGIAALCAQQRTAAQLGRSFITKDPVGWLAPGAPGSRPPSASSASLELLLEGTNDVETWLAYFRALIYLSCSLCTVGQHLRNPSLVVRRLVQVNNVTLVAEVLHFWRCALETHLRQAEAVVPVDAETCALMSQWLSDGHEYLRDTWNALHANLTTWSDYRQHQQREEQEEQLQHRLRAQDQEQAQERIMTAAAERADADAIVRGDLMVI
jgi:hypothetical protein